ncbi:histidine kinase [Pseudoalteromonas sp. G4]|uniref:histidine kinase n=1 Tax=Pseudoalteromonas sp. G4 TaxID=2992761 RepID=UPI00237D951E|nr:sensor histidine kinase [Pseudoalteromonas sp. G4]MDE3273354.1 histidine kinase [Pseudoalteromonas sp. G4]
MNKSNDYYIAQGIITALILFFPLVAVTFIAPEKLIKYAHEWLLYTLMLVSVWHFVTRRFIKRMLQKQRFYRALVVLSAVIISVAILYLPNMLLSYIWYVEPADREQLVRLLTKFNIFLSFVWTIGYVSAQAVREKTSIEKSIRHHTLKMLSQQVQPAFLYQCLDNIEALMDKNIDSASESITDLAELLRYKLQAGKQDLVELQLELNALGYMQRLANAGDLTVSVTPDLAERSITVPPLLVYNLLYMLNLKVSQPLHLEVVMAQESCILQVSGFSFQPRLIMSRIKHNYAEFFASQQASISYHNKVLSLTING